MIVIVVQIVGSEAYREAVDLSFCCSGRDRKHKLCLRVLWHQQTKGTWKGNANGVIVVDLLRVSLSYFYPLLCLSQTIFQPSEPAVSLAKECVDQGCGVHVFVLSQQDVGGAWPGHVPYLTGGVLHTYSYLQVHSLRMGSLPWRFTELKDLIVNLKVSAASRIRCLK